MDFYETLKSGALCGKGGGGGGGRSNEGNLIQTELEQGYYAQDTREEKASTNSVRVKGTIAIEYNQAYALVWAFPPEKQIWAYGYQYAADGTYLGQIDYRGSRPAPISITGMSGVAYITLMFIANGSLTPEEVGVPTLVKC